MTARVRVVLRGGGGGGRGLEIGGRAPRGQAIWEFLAAAVLGCCLGCWLSVVRGAGVQSLARVSLSGLYAGVLFSKKPQPRGSKDENYFTYQSS